jgi:hypothetical protein
MGTILDHDYTTGVLRYRVVAGDGCTWVLAQELSDESLIRDYWCRLGVARASALPPMSPTNASISELVRLIAVKRERENTYIPSEFDGFDAPVLVPIKVLENGFPQKFIDFLEAKVSHGREGTE